ncbi:expressed unknown protein [Seminavis robusta]|uniref:SCP domain-containing protein n=1 Tax=Seminavis robusta TaxID=568900 RepID=A0A9N8DBF6_9STRA|nr:expressed unknown protein [Seminavis robusta]|eukprot:Sro23_g015850.1 n/a (243) ;mRNA; r:87725-88453
MIIDLLRENFGKFLPRTNGFDSCFPETTALIKHGKGQKNKQACTKGDDDWHKLELLGSTSTESCSSTTSLSISDYSIECQFRSPPRPRPKLVPPPPVKADPPASNDLELPVLNTKRSRKLPGTWYYSSNHIMINTERTKKNIHPLTRKSELDATARWHAEAMAGKDQLFHAGAAELQQKVARPCRRLGVNVFRGESIRAIHNEMMGSKTDVKNMLDSKYFEFGMATARSPSGDLMLCQVFIG